MVQLNKLYSPNFVIFKRFI